MSVYVLMHDDRMDDMGDTYVRAIYEDRATAEGDIVSRTSSGRRSIAYDAHNESCCGVQEWDVLSASVPDIKADPPPFDGPYETLIPDAVSESIFAHLTKKGPYA